MIKARGKKDRKDITKHLSYTHGRHFTPVPLCIAISISVLTVLPMIVASAAAAADDDYDDD